MRLRGRRSRAVDPGELASDLAALIDRLAITVAEVNRAIGAALAPVIDDLARELRHWYATWPGMPYTAPSLWDASQMAADTP